MPEYTNIESVPQGAKLGGRQRIVEYVLDWELNRVVKDTNERLALLYAGRWDDLRFPAQAINPVGLASPPTRESGTGLFLF